MNETKELSCVLRVLIIDEHEEVEIERASLSNESPCSFLRGKDLVDVGVQD